MTTGERAGSLPIRDTRPGEFTMSSVEMESTVQTRELALDMPAVETRWLMSSTTDFFTSRPPGRVAIEQHEPNFPGYTVLELAGYGGFGAVYRAREDLLDREVALKVPLPHDENL